MKTSCKRKATVWFDPDIPIKIIGSESIRVSEAGVVSFSGKLGTGNTVVEEPDGFYEENEYHLLPSVAIGEDNEATGEGSMSVGYLNKSSGYSSFSFGNYNDSSNDCAGSFGSGNKSLGYYSFSAGANNSSSGSRAVSLGGSNTTSGASAASIGSSNITSGNYSVSLGNLNKASGTSCVSMGYYSGKNIGSGNYSFCSGYISDAAGDFSVSIGAFTKAYAKGSVALGYQSTARGEGSFSVAVTGGSGPGAYAAGEATFGLHPIAHPVGYQVSKWKATDRLFVIANSQTKDTNLIDLATPNVRTHAFTMWKNGNTQMGTTTAPADNGNTLNVLGRMSADLPVYATKAAANSDAALSSRTFYRLADDSVHYKP